MMIKRVLLATSLIAHLTGEPVFMHIFVHNTKPPTPTPRNPLTRLTRAVGTLTTTTPQTPPPNTALFDQWFMLEDGLVYVSEIAINHCRTQTLTPQLSRRAAVHLINAYDALVNKQNTTHRYYTFGWNPAEDNTYTQQAHTLYTQIIEERDRLRNWYQDRPIAIIAHGHGYGGHLILQLAEQERLQGKNLEIEQVFLYGTPIRLELTRALLHPMFKGIINLFSLGDRWQTNNQASMSEQNYRTIAEIRAWDNTEEKYLIDTTVSVNGNTQAFNHAALFCLDDSSYQAPYFEAIKPFPLVTFAPALQDLIKKLRKKPATMHVNVVSNSQCYLELTASRVRGRFVTPNLNPRLASARRTIEQVWRPLVQKGTMQSSIRSLTDSVMQTPRDIFQDYIKPWFD